MAQLDCKHFCGYKPCAFQKDAQSAGLRKVCEQSCSQYQKIENKILLIHLGALGAVVRSTALLKAIHRKYPHAQITWVTDKPAHQLLQNHPLIDRVLTTDASDLLVLKALHFTAAMVIDKSLKAMGVLAQTSADQVFGFQVHAQHGVIIPATAAAEELWKIGLDDHVKFFVNRKTEIELTHQALELGEYLKEDYELPLSAAEDSLKMQRRQEWQVDHKNLIIGLNTGCSHVLPHKKLSVPYHRDLILKLKQMGFQNIVLLGGPEDTERNAQIAHGLNVVQSATEKGLRDGLVSVAACDVIITGDSLGMHMAISQKKYVIAWFGPTCSHEIELYSRGKAVESQAPCAPCWKRSCQKTLMCYDLVNIDHILQEVAVGVEFIGSEIKHDQTDSVCANSVLG